MITTVLHLIALGMLAVLGWLVFVFFNPHRPCRWCKNRKRPRRCWRCHGHREYFRLGAGLAHKVKLSLIEAWQEREFWR